MLVSFYAQIFVIGTSLLIILLPFLGFPQSWDSALTAMFGLLIFGVGTHGFYSGYVLILKKEERRIREREARSKKKTEKNRERNAKENKALIGDKGPTDTNALDDPLAVEALHE